MRFVIWGLCSSGNQYWLTSRLSCFEAKFLMGSSWGNLWITLLKYQGMLLNQWRAYERGGSFLNRGLFTEESLRMSIVLNWLWRVNLIDPKRFLYQDLGRTLRRKGSIKSQPSIHRGIFLMALRAGRSSMALTVNSTLISHLVGYISPYWPCSQRIRLEAVCVQWVWNEILFRWFLSEYLSTVHLAILALWIEAFRRHHLTNSLVRLHKLETSGLEVWLGCLLS